MTFHPGPSICPQVGGIYQLRAGLTACVTHYAIIQGHVFWKGIFLEGAGGECMWFARGHYSVDIRYYHELDIMRELA